MGFDPLPRVYLTWDESSEPLDAFLRYQVYRRVSGTGDWSKRARINDRSITFWEDTMPHSEVVYEYVVTQVIDVSGEEIESVFPSPVSGGVTINDLFIHDVRHAEHYVQVMVPTQRVRVAQPIAYTQSWGRRAPTAHIGNVFQHEYSFSMNGAWRGGNPTISADQWRAIVVLMGRQRAGSPLMARQSRDVALIGHIHDPARDDERVGFRETLTFRETHYREEVD